MPRPLDRPRQLLAAGGNLRVAGLGDSLTYGWMTRQSFFDRFCDGLAARFPAAAILRRNAGVPGDTAAGGLARLPELLAWQPDLLVVQFGLNDCFQDVPLDAFEVDIASIVEQAQAAGAAVVVCTSCPLPSPSEAACAKLYSDALRTLPQPRGAALADLERGWWHAAPTDAPPLWQTDGVHPTDAGHQLMADALLEALLSEVKAGSGGSESSLGLEH